VKIAVCVKVVPRQAVALRLDPATGRLDRSGASEVNASDEYAIEEALQLRERGGGDVVALSMGPADGAESLRSALAMGADRAVVAADPRLAGADLVGTSRVLAALIARESPDLVLFGAQTLDGGGAMLWAAVCERLGWPVLSGVRNVELADGLVRAVRQTAAGESVVAAPTPCVVGLSGAVNAPRYPSFRNVVASKRKEIALLSTDELGVAVGEGDAAVSRTTVVRLAPAPPRRTGGEIVTDDGNGAAWLFEFLSSRGFA
jgi:electron transfer flavoprotein beta subunit